MIDASLVTGSALAATTALRPAVEADWDLRAGTLELSCFEVGVHVASSLVWYASQVALRRVDGYLPFDVTLEETATPTDLVDLIGVAGELLARTIERASVTDRAFHFWGVSDPEGFAAMGALETLVHTKDVAVGLGLDWRPPATLAAPVVARLFPDAPRGDATDVLLWCTGRSPLDGVEPPPSWRWYADVR